MKKRETGINLIILLANLFFYLVFFIADGVKLAVDSQSYIMGAYSREPLYPVLLWLFRIVFGENRYFFWVVLVQCLLAGVAAWRFTTVLRKKLELTWFPLLVVIGLQFAVIVMLRFVANRGSTYCNSICSEGIAIPLFTLFISELLLFVWEKKERNLLLTMLYAVALLSTRKQMYIVLAIMGIVYVSMFAARRMNVKKCMLAIATVAGALFLAVGADMLYNLVHRGEAMRHTTDSSALVISTLYSSELEDADYFADADMKNLFITIMTGIEEGEYSYQYAQSGWMQLYNHYSDHYDNIAFDIVNPAFYAYIDSSGIYSDNEREKCFTQLNHEVLKTLLPVNWGQMAKVTMANILTGFCNTVSKPHRFLNWYNALFYVLYIIMLVRLVIKKQNSSLFWCAFVVLIATVVNAGAVGVMIFAQSRYMIYNMPLIYVVLFLMLYFYTKEFLMKRKMPDKTGGMKEE
ncbi:MAG: hypothetical protein HDR08_07920 [Lachnospiraceae bacterium]|nr:hypothetical protein [Lachnospiraceae bacterium]MBD5511164.1 hypothetical protein [Lachnospiraceae bacterium]